jgi:hypothetical protein
MPHRPRVLSRHAQTALLLSSPLASSHTPLLLSLRLRLLHVWEDPLDCAPTHLQVYVAEAHRVELLPISPRSSAVAQSTEATTAPALSPRQAKLVADLAAKLEKAKAREAATQAEVAELMAKHKRCEKRGHADKAASGAGGDKPPKAE